MIYLLTIILIFLLFFLVPVRISIILRKFENISLIFNVYFIEGLFGLHAFSRESRNYLQLSLIWVPVFKYNLKSSDKTKKEVETGRHENTKNRKKKKTVRTKEIINLIRKYSAPTKSYFRRLKGIFSLDRFDAVGSFGVNDNYLNGMIYGAVHSITPFFPNRISINLDPVFNENVFRGTVRLKGSIQMYRAVLASLYFAFSILITKLKK